MPLKAPDPIWETQNAPQAPSSVGRKLSGQLPPPKLISWINPWLASELESDLCDTEGWGRKWLVDFNAGKIQLVSFDRSNNTGAIDVKTQLIFSSKLDWDSYIISAAKTASKKIGALIHSMKFLSLEGPLYLFKSPIGQVLHGIRRWGEWPRGLWPRRVLHGGLRCCTQNQKVPGSKPTICLAGLRDPTSLQGSQWNSGWKCKKNP